LSAGARKDRFEDLTMPHNQSAVRQILDQAKAAGRSALTAPEARGVCEAYGIAVPKEGVAKSAG
jgi:acyl-CoA synthetase (NDP forming)